jgi:hypothetical protein
MRTFPERNRSASAGYLLVETVVSMAVLSVSMLYLHSAIRQGVQVHAQAQDYTTARFLLREVLSEQELQPQLVVTSESGTFPPPNTRFFYNLQISKEPIPLPEIPSNVPRETRAWITQNFHDYIGKVSVNIQWSRGGVDEQVLGETLLRPGQLWIPPKRKR